MSEPKTKPEMKAPKARPTGAAPKEAGFMTRRRYSEAKAQRATNKGAVQFQKGDGRRGGTVRAAAAVRRSIQNMKQPKERKGEDSESTEPVRYATGKVEETGRRGASLTVDGTRRAVRQVRQHSKERAKEPKKESAAAREPEPPTGEQPSRDTPKQADRTPKQAERSPKQAERGQVGQSRVPQQERRAAPKTRQNVAEKEMVEGATNTARSSTGEAVNTTVTPKTRQNTVKERTKIETSQPVTPTAQELRRQKVVQDTVRARQEARRGMDAELSRMDSAEQKLLSRPEVPGGAPAASAHPGKPADAPHPSAEKPGKRGKVRLPDGSGIPSKPTFALKERHAGRSLQENAAAAVRQTKQAAVQKLRRQAARKNTQRAQKTAKQAVKAAKAVAVAVKSAVVSVAALGGGATLMIVVVCFMVLIGGIVASPFGIFFANENVTEGTVPISAAVAQVNYDFNARLEELKGQDTYDDVTINGSTADWVEVLAVFATKVAGGGADAADVATMDANRVDRLKAVFWDMNAIETEKEIIDHHDSDPDDDEDDSWTETILHITITPKTAADMPDVYHFSANQAEAMNELLAEREMLQDLLGTLTPISPEAGAVMTRLPDDLSTERREVVRVACSLVGKVSYFWGGKSSAIGWDSRWGQPTLVTAPGHSATGTYQPFGLDCSGFLDWSFRNAGLPSDGHWYIGRNLTEISQAQARPGDIALFADASHLGFVVGRSSSGRILVCHCSSGRGGVVITEFASTGFTVLGRPGVYTD